MPRRPSTTKARAPVELERRLRAQAWTIAGKTLGLDVVVVVGSESADGDPADTAPVGTAAVGIAAVGIAPTGASDAEPPVTVRLVVATGLSSTPQADDVVASGPRSAPLDTSGGHRMRRPVAVGAPGPCRPCGRS